MFDEFVYVQSPAEYANKILLIDDDQLETSTGYSVCFSACGFEVVRYVDDLWFRVNYENKIKSGDGKFVVIAKTDQYIPYDLQKRMSPFTVSLASLFPRLNSDAIAGKGKLDYNLISQAYLNNFDNFSTYEETEQFLREFVYTKKNVEQYLEKAFQKLLEKATGCDDYKDWFVIAEEKAQLDVLAVKYQCFLDTTEINQCFKNYVLSQYGKLSTCLDSTGPVLVSRAMEYMKENSQRFVIIVMDGMAEFDWNVLQNSFNDLVYHKSSAFAMIPTVTSVSRQCLLSNKFPVELLEPWKQSKEKNEFVACAKEMGFNENQISYQRGYNSEFAPSVRCGAVIINDIDDIVHGQKLGRTGMYHEIKILADQAKLATMVKRFLSAGFDVYISADHGNTTRKGMGKVLSTGVETETKSKCLLVLKDFADKDGIKTSKHLLEFPKYYLPKTYDYLICDVGESFDAKDEEVMSHGGISIDECIVPFIQIKAEENHG